jgi:hypothetical protein
MYVYMSFFPNGFVFREIDPEISSLEIIVKYMENSLFFGTICDHNHPKCKMSFVFEISAKNYVELYVFQNKNFPKN